MYQLHSLSSSVQPKTISIHSSLSIGRGSDNDIIINHASVAVHHAKIHLDNEQIYIEDLNSDTGTFIGDYKIEADNQYQLSTSQTIIFGEVTYMVEEKEMENTADKEFIIGRNPQSDMVINIDSVSSSHLIIRKEQGEWYIIDDNSTNGTYLDSYSIENKIDKIKLEANQKIYLSSYKLNTNDILNILENKKSQTTLIHSDLTTFGRDPSSTICIDNLNVSWNHAQIMNEHDRYYINDLNSSNGTFVNGLEIDDSKEIFQGDTISLGLYSFIFQYDKNAKLSLLKINENGFTIDAKDISCKVNIGSKYEKNLLQNINFTVYPGEIVGLMGLSGAGKTTLLKTLSGYTQPTEGKVFVNGLDLYKNFDRIKNSIGYVPQEDIIHPELTVYEALFYSLKLRSKEKLYIEEINEKIDTILVELGLSISGEDDIRGVKIGSPEDKGTSGGQRKRINIAMELLADPEIIFLDEPTSGLSSVDATVVMDKLKELADKGKTIILTIHQPSLVNYKKMDDMIILTKGELAYFGPNYPESIKFFNNDTDSAEILNDPDMALLGLHKGEVNNINWSHKYEGSDLHDKFVKDRGSTLGNEEMSSHSTSTSSWSQLTTLTSRYLKIKIKDKINTGILLIQAPVIAILLAFLFSGDGEKFHQEHPNILLFILVISSMWFGIINAVKEIVGEKAIYERERLIGLKLFPYILSKFLILAILSLIQVAILIGIVIISPIPLELNFLYLLILVFVTALSGVAIGLLTSAIASSVSQALSLVPIILLPMIIFGGGMIPINKLSSVPSFFNAYNVSFIMPTRWALEEGVRIFDKGDDNSSIAIREPKCNKDNLLLYVNKEVEVLYSNDENTLGTCQDRRCIEELYIKEHPNDDNRGEYICRANSTHENYFVLILLITLPLLFVMFILYRKDKS